MQRCDFGSRVKLPVSSLRPLKPALQGSLALECKLADIRLNRHTHTQYRHYLRYMAVDLELQTRLSLWGCPSIEVVEKCWRKES